MTEPHVAAPDRLILPALQAVRWCATTQLALTGIPVCHSVLYFSDHYPPAQGCDCRCTEPPGGQGVAWARFVQGQASTSPATPAPCASGQVAFTLEVGVYRCAPTLDGNGNPLSEDHLQGWPEAMMHDLAALRRAFTCCPYFADNDLTPQITAMNPIGPMGGCVGAAVRAQIVDLDCHCPPGVNA